MNVPSMIPRRKITGLSAVLLPFHGRTSVDWDGFEAHVRRTVEAGLIPAVNMDTGYISIIDEATQSEVLSRTSRLLDGQTFVAGAYVSDQPGDAVNGDAYHRQTDAIHASGGTPVIFQSFGLTQQSDDAIVESYRSIATSCDRFIAFELSPRFAPFGTIYSIDVYRELMKIPQCEGAKHSSLHRQPEWDRLALRDAERPDFRVYTGNDLAIDMVMYGSDYLLGLSSFAPDLFARRDAMWKAGDPSFHQLNDVLQYLGFFAFRSPVPAYKHSCAQFLHLRGMIGSDRTHPDSAKRPESDLPVLTDILRQLDEFC